ncbi:AIG1 family protein [Echinococcus multilocularis]|uniref:AIG1 family protein n=1 Tax=Echinococcus multilocularis TaxID=6211 RepID=A0A0S4MLX2_ECHMU|nr:AIG1 family protein [Echinococcus multilocularis]
MFVPRTMEQALRRRTFPPRPSDRRGNATSEGGDEADDQAMEIDEARQIWRPLGRLPSPRAEEFNSHKAENEIERSFEWGKEYDEAMCK